MVGFIGCCISVFTTLHASMYYANDIIGFDYEEEM
jgi:hypothetical protein